MYKDDDVIVREPWDIREIEGYSGAFCKCGRVLHIKTPGLQQWCAIKCPKCGFVVNLFCGKIGEWRMENGYKLSISDVGTILKGDDSRDLVEVVRCRDCGYYSLEHLVCKGLPTEPMVQRFPDDYCSKGKRK